MTAPRAGAGSRTSPGGRRRRPLRRRLFAWFGVTIVAAIALSSAVHFLLSPASPRWRELVARSEAFVDGRFARVWDDAGIAVGLGLLALTSFVYALRIARQRRRRAGGLPA